MRYRLDLTRPAVTFARRPFRLAATGIAAVIVAWLMSQWVPCATAQEPGLLPALEPGELVDGPPACAVGSTSFYSQSLGTLLRVRYNTESYGQNRQGNLDVGTMQVFNFQDAITFIDGQITLNDVQGAGFNIGVGGRWLTTVPFPWEPERMSGVSVWADGTSTEAGNFFPQVGVSYESLGDLWDFRANGYFPLGKEDQIGHYTPTGTTGYQGNFLSELTRATVDHSLNVGEFEVARRLGAERDAWLFAGGYALVNDTEDTGGYRIGLRGYAYPDVLLQIAISDDDLFKTNAAFSLTWFVGRTRSDYHPTCGLPDRFREPVLRNDYVALTHTTTFGGTPLTDPDTGEAIRVVHVDSSAPAGGDGTYENPYDMLSDINGAGSQTGDIILAHAESVFNDDTVAALKNDQRLLGEGNGIRSTVTTAEQGTINLPETSTGALSATRPAINAAVGTAVLLADGNEVGNLTFDGQSTTTTAIGSPGAGAGNPNLHDLAISNTVGNGIELTAYDFVDSADTDGDGNTTETIVHGNVTIGTRTTLTGTVAGPVTLTDIGGNGIDITATTLDVTQPNVQLDEVLSLSNITSTDGTGRGIAITGTHTGTGNTTTLTDYTYDGGTTSLGAIQLDNFDGTFTASNSTLTGGATTGQGVQILGDSDGTITFASTVAFNNLDGTAFDINGDFYASNEFDGTVTVNSAITNDTGLSASVQGVGTGSVTFAGDFTDTDQGIRATSNGGGTILFSGDLALTTGDDTAILLTDNADGGTDTGLDFTGKLTITTTGGNGFEATGGGGLTVAGTTNSIKSTGGTPLTVTDMTISSAGVSFADVSATGGAGGINLQDNTGGTITVGTTTDTAGDAGTISGVTGNAIVIKDSADVSITGLKITNPGAADVAVTHSTADTMTVDLSDLAITAGNAGIAVVGGGTGNLNMTVNDTTIEAVTGKAVSIDNVDAGTIDGNNVDIDGRPTLANGTKGGIVANSAGIYIANSDATISFDADSSTQSLEDPDFEVSGGAGTISMDGDITNSNAGDTTGRSIYVHGITDGSVSLTGTVEDSGTGINISNNTGGDINLLGDYTLNAVANNRVVVQNNTGANVSLTGLDIAATGAGAGLNATGGGTLTIIGSSNTITTENGVGLELQNMTVGTSGVNFKSVTVGTAAGGPANGIVLANNTGGTIAVGASGNAAGEGGTIQKTTEAGVKITNTANVVLNGVTVDDANTAAAVDQAAIEIAHTNAASMNVTLNDANVDTSVDGLHVDGTGGTGTFSLTMTDADIAASGGRAIEFEVLHGTVTGNNVDVHNSGSGIRIAGGDGSVTFNSTSSIKTATGTAFELTADVNGNNAIDGGETWTGTVSMAGGITNTAGRSIDVHHITGGTATFTGTVTDTGTGIQVVNSTGGTVNLLGDYTLGTAADALSNTAFTFSDNSGSTSVSANDLTIFTKSTGRGVSISGNTSGTSSSFTNVVIDTTAGSGAGFMATGGGTLTATGTNTIHTDTGVGLDIEDMTIGGSGATFQSVTVDNGSSKGIILTNLTGGSVSVTGTGTTNGSGGTLHTDGNAIELTNVTNASLSNIQVTDIDNAATHAVAITNSNSAAMTTTLTNVDIEDATADGFNVSNTGSGTLTLNLTDSDVAGVTDQAFDLTANGSTNKVNITIDGLTTTDHGITVATGASAALDLIIRNSTVDNANTSMTLDSSGDFGLLVENSSFQADSGITFGLDFQSGTHNADVTVQNNIKFEAEDATAFNLAVNGTSADVNFLLDNNTFTNNSAGSETFLTLVNGGATLDANVVNNDFTNSLAADEFAMTSDGSSTQINLNLNNNTSSGVYELTTSNNNLPADYNFAVQDRDNTNSNNTGTVNFNPAIGDFDNIPGPVQEPQFP